jgi:ATP adenylyltransferase
MRMKHLWSPWRMKYIQQHQRDSRCVFCNALEKPDSPDNLIVVRGRLAFVILNRYPYTSGHLMVVPFQHTNAFTNLSSEGRAEIFELINQSMLVLGRVYEPGGFNLGANVGSVAGAGIAAHVHFHVVPRWGGDTNFMSSVGETRVLPEDLDQTYRRVQAAWIELASG